MILIQSVLFFILGAAITAFVLTLFAPIMWRRALYLARKAVKTEVPLSLTEVEADRDFLRASHALELCRLEERIKRSEERELEARLALDHARERIFFLFPFEQQAAEMHGKAAESLKEIAALKGEIGEHNRLIRGLGVIKKKSEKQERALKERRDEINAQRRQIADLNRDIAALNAEIARLESDKAALNVHISNIQYDDREKLLGLRAELKQLAASVVAQVAAAEGKNSPLLALVDRPESDKSLAAAIQNAMIRAAQLEERALSGK